MTRAVELSPKLFSLCNTTGFNLSINTIRWNQITIVWSKLTLKLLSLWLRSIMNWISDKTKTNVTVLLEILSSMKLLFLSDFIAQKELLLDDSRTTPNICLVRRFRRNRQACQENWLRSAFYTADHAFEIARFAKVVAWRVAKSHQVVVWLLIGAWILFFFFVFFLFMFWK